MYYLVVEDDPDYIRIAKETIGQEEVIYASSFEEAVILLPDAIGVITDLFFPGPNFRLKWLSEIRKSGEKEALEFEAKAETETEKNRVTFYQHLAVQCRKALLNWNRLEENPAGLAVAIECWERGIPFVMLTQGNRHYGSLALSREAVRFVPKFEMLCPGVLDPLPRIELTWAIETDKSKPETWLKAVEIIKEGGILEKRKQI